MSALSFDELNEFEKYYEPMEISADGKARRVALAELLFDVMLFFFSAFRVFRNNNTYPLSYYEDMLRERLSEAVSKQTGIDGYLSDHITQLTQETVETTYKRFKSDVGTDNTEDVTEETDNTDYNYWLSDSRAFFIATNEANTILNYTDFVEAKTDGKTQKRWLTMGDEKVRKTHSEIDGETIDIDDVFVVGTSLMRFPHDVEYGANPSEYIRCRCSCEYL